MDSNKPDVIFKIKLIQDENGFVIGMEEPIISHSSFDEWSSHLEHVGVKGMKWGVRKDKKKAGSSRPKSVSDNMRLKKDMAKVERTIARRKKWAKEDEEYIMKGPGTAEEKKRKLQANKEYWKSQMGYSVEDVRKERNRNMLLVAGVLAAAATKVIVQRKANEYIINQLGGVDKIFDASILTDK